MLLLEGCIHLFFVFQYCVPLGTELTWHPCALKKAGSYLEAEFTVTIKVTAGDPDRRWPAVATYLFMSRERHRRQRFVTEQHSKEQTKRCYSASHT